MHSTLQYIDHDCILNFEKRAQNSSSKELIVSERHFNIAKEEPPCQIKSSHINRLQCLILALHQGNVGLFDDG